jgi:undecaprenyl-diphosphatase
VIALDRRVEHWIVAHRTGWLDWLSILLSRIGTLGLVWLALAAALALLWRRPWLALPVLVADVAAELLADLGKLLVHRHRPFVHQLGPPTTTHSFPSGHTATSFACATVLAAAAPRLRVPFFGLATLIALSRLYNGDHFPLDVIAGAVLGVVVGLTTVRRAPRWRLPARARSSSSRRRRAGEAELRRSG